MSNLITIEIRADDNTGPGFASALARVEALKQALKGLGIGIDTHGIDGQLSYIKSRLQAHGIADLLDINMNAGQVESQLQFLKRKIQDAKITDILDINANTSEAKNAIAGLAADLGHEHLTVDVTPKIDAPVSGFGLAQSFSEKIDITGLNNASTELAGVQSQTKQLGDAFVSTSAAKDKFSGNVTGNLVPALRLGGFNFNFLRQHVNLFGGALGTLPFLGTVTGLHLLLDGIVEVAAELVPAAIAFGAFAAAAVPAVMSIYKQEQALYTVSQAFNQQMPGLSGGFQKVAAAVKPEVYILFGEALDTMNRNTGTFMTLATGAGHVLDELGARAELALGSNGMSGFAKKAVDDLQVVGNIIGNVFGIFGNFLKVMPGYAEILFHALQDVTGALEALTGNSVVQGMLSIGLSLHGFIVWGGLAATAAIALGNAITGLGVKMGLLAAGTKMFDGAAFAAGMYQAAGGVALMGKELITFGAAEDIAAAGTLSLEGVMAAIAAVNPVVWIAAAIGAIAGLVMWLGSMKTASQQAFDAFQKQLANASTFTTAFATITEGIKATNSALSDTPKYIDVMTHSAHDQYTMVQELNPAWQQLQDNLKTFGSQQSTLTTRMDELNKITGSQAASLNALNTIGVKAGDVATESAAAFANQVTQVRALTDATTQLAGFTAGQAAAAQNALTNAFMTGTLPAIQKVTQAEDALMTVITGGETAFIGFQQGLNTMATDAQAAGAAVGGLSANSLTLSSDFYSSVGNAQKLTDALQSQGVSAANLTTAVATISGEMLTYAGNNTAAKSVIVDLINNALGPGTVSMQNLDKWVQQNSTSLGGLNNIIATATVNAGTLAGVLQNSLNAQFQAALLKASGASQAISAMADAITHGGTQTAAYAGARAQLIADLEKTGMSSQTATQYVDGLQQKIDALHGKTVDIHANTPTAQIQSFQQMVDSLHGTTITIGVQQVGSAQIAQGFVAGTGGPGHAMGGIVGNIPHAASGGVRNGLTLVGELGPELVRLPAGSQVYPHGVTPSGQSSWGSGDVHITLELGQSFRQAGLSQQQLEDIRYTVRTVGGGNVQAALGRA